VVTSLKWASFLHGGGAKLEVMTLFRQSRR
jgi:hypothetical protein